MMKNISFVCRSAKVAAFAGFEYIDGQIVSIMYDSAPPVNFEFAAEISCVIVFL
jgi:hypothetical protein